MKLNCILFGGKIDAKGYGYICKNNKVYKAHRIAYVEHNGISIDDIKGLVVRHSCDNPQCINPDHLVVGTQAQNIQDKVDRNRQAKGNSHGIAKLSVEDVKSIRSAYISGSKYYGANALARKYGVNQSTITRAVNGDLWRHC